MGDTLITRTLTEVGNLQVEHKHLISLTTHLLTPSPSLQHPSSPHLPPPPQPHLPQTTQNNIPPWASSEYSANSDGCVPPLGTRLVVRRRWRSWWVKQGGPIIPLDRMLKHGKCASWAWLVCLEVPRPPRPQAHLREATQK